MKLLLKAISNRLRSISSNAPLYIPVFRTGIWGEKYEIKEDYMSFRITSELQRVHLAFCLINTHSHSEMLLHPLCSFPRIFPLKKKTTPNVNVSTPWNDGHRKGKNDGYKEAKEFDFKKIATCLNL